MQKEQRKLVITKNEKIIDEKTFSSAEEMMDYASQFSKRLAGGDVLLLSGELGAGKTTFTKGLAQGFGVTRDVTSPTFIIMNIYAVSHSKENIVQLCHIDAYRLSSNEELLAIGTDEYIGEPRTITALEWPERVFKKYPPNAYFLKFELV